MYEKLNKAKLCQPYNSNKPGVPCPTSRPSAPSSAATRSVSIRVSSAPVLLSLDSSQRPRAALARPPPALPVLLI
ncbi:hypothetical protein PERCYII40_3390 [Pseudomonas aeruginosa]|nr:hypothetical protein PERCYII40_3390 [Pseudomonas aeruginosa]